MLFKVGPSLQCEKQSEKSKIFADVSKNKQIFYLILPFFVSYKRVSLLLRTYFSVEMQTTCTPAHL